MDRCDKGHTDAIGCSWSCCDHEQLWNFIYSFHMPAFVAISGYVAYRPNRVGGDCLKTHSSQNVS